MVLADASTMILATVILFAIIAIFANRVNQRRIRTAGKTLPGPPRWPLLGNTFYFTQKVEDMLNVLASLFDSYPSIYQIRVGPAMIVNINDPDLSKAVLVDHKLIERAYVEMLLKSAIGTGLITARSAIWRLHRKIIGPSFNSMFLRHFIDVFDTQSEIMVKQLEAHQDGPEFDLEHYLSPCMFDIINETAMNVKLGTQMNKDHEFKKSVDSIHEIITQRFLKPWLHPAFFFNLSPLGARYAQMVKDGRSFMRHVIEKQMEDVANQRRHPNVADHEDHAATSPIRRKTILDLLMNCDNGGVKMPDEEIIDELLTILISATDTTVTATNMLMLALACYPDVQEKVYDEVTEVCGHGEDAGQTITVDQLNNLVYVERVAKEILRLFPIVCFVSRDVMEDMTIGDYDIPKGAVVAIAIFALHRNEQFWPDPLKFDPDRFLPEEVEKRHPYAYMPFGGGSRNCIGTKYAMMAMKIVCAKIVQKYALEKDHPKNIADTKMKIGISMKPCDRVTVRIRKRQASIAQMLQKLQGQE